VVDGCRTNKALPEAEAEEEEEEGLDSKALPQVVEEVKIAGRQIEGTEEEEEHILEGSETSLIQLPLPSSILLTLMTMDGVCRQTHVSIVCKLLMKGELISSVENK